MNGRLACAAGLTKAGDAERREMPMHRRFTVCAGLTSAVLALAGCGEGRSSPVEHAELRYLKTDATFAGMQSVSCAQRGHFVAIRDVTYSGYACTVHGGRGDDGNVSVWWDGTRLYHDCANLPPLASNALCFD